MAAATAQNALEKEVAALTKARDAAVVDEEEKERAFANAIAKQRSEWEREVRWAFVATTAFASFAFSAFLYIYIYIFVASFHAFMHSLSVFPFPPLPMSTHVCTPVHGCNAS